MRGGTPQLPNATFDFLPFAGGVDYETPSWEVKPGYLKDSQNFEIAITGGYADLTGYERIDGRPAPSAALYAVINLTISGSFAIGNAITQLTSGATAVVAAVSSATSPQYLVITKIVGTFNATSAIQVAAVTQGTATGLAIIDGASTPKLAAQYKAAAASIYRTDILVVPGEGSILGVVYLNGVTYAVRNAAGGATAAIYKTTAGGWSLVALGFELAFTSGGTFVSLEGATITGATSGATAVLTRVMIQTGSYAGGDATGKYIFASKTGNFVAENIDIGANPNVATIAGNATAITLLPSGRYEFFLSNFANPAGLQRAYGCDGVNRGFEFDGAVFCPIRSGMTTDTPTHVVVHKFQLFFSFGSSIQHGGINLPYTWTALVGAGELSVGDPVTAFQIQPASIGGGTLSIYSRNLISMLYGNTPSDWQLAPYRPEVGAFAYTVQQLGYSIFLHDRGITTLKAVQEFGNFADMTMSARIQSYVNARRTTARDSMISRDKNQYRIFFADKSGLYATIINGKIAGFMPIAYAHDVTCAVSSETSSGAEIMLFGSSDGYVRQLEKGTSFDGTAITAYIQTQYHYAKSLGWLKRYLSAVLEVKGQAYSEFMFSYQLGYNTTDLTQPLGADQVGALTNSLTFTPVFWDSFIWDAFFWDGTALTPSRSKLAGEAENISLWIRKSADYMTPVTYTGARIRQVLRRQVR